MVAYRNYNSTKDMLLQASTWASDADYLEQFLQTLNVSGGYGREAIEVGLAHANEEHAKEAVD